MVYAAAVLVLFGLAALPADGQITTRDAREIRDITRQLSSQVNSFQNDLSYQLRRNNTIGRDQRERLEDDVRSLGFRIADFEASFERRKETAEDVRKVLLAGKKINDFISYNSINSRTDRDWETIVGLLDRLAENYNVDWSWDNLSRKDARYGQTGGTVFQNNLTGTYRIDPARSENTGEIARRAIRSNDIRDREDQRDLERKLSSPAEISIAVRGGQVVLKTSDTGEQIAFAADGRERMETLADGERVRVRATLRGEQLVISSFGDQTDYTVTFTPIDGGRGMRVTRRFTTDYLRQTVFAESVYQKTANTAADINVAGDPDDDDYADSGDYSSSDPDDLPGSSSSTKPVPGRTGNYIVPDGMIILGTLDTQIDTKASQNNDRFQMSVTSPNRYRGAVIEGYISGINRSGKVSGRSEVTFNFQTIRLRNGEVYDFAGFLQSIKDEEGNVIKVDEEGTAKGNSRTKETVKRSGIGAGIGALIGAIAGGAKGAAIGAVIGGGAGAGSVIIEGKGDLKLDPGTEVTIKASSPIR